MKLEIEYDDDSLGVIERINTLFKKNNIPLVFEDISEEDKSYMVYSLKFKTSTKDINGKTICVGDKIKYVGDEDDTISEVIFEKNCFRKKYLDKSKWDQTLDHFPLEENPIEGLNYIIIN